MKNHSEVESRLKKLRTRYAHKHVENTQKRCFKNCTFNAVHKTEKLDYGQVETELELSPRIQKTSVFINDENKAIHLCMYGAKDPSTWSGDICDNDEKARHCPMFKPTVTVEQAKLEFLERLSDDEFVFDNYRDVATLQWVLNQRVHEIPLTLFERFWFWLRIKFWRPEPALPQLASPELTDDLWKEDK